MYDVSAIPLMYYKKERRLNPGELDRLLKIIKSPQTEPALFFQAVIVLDAMVEEEKFREVSKMMADLLSAKDSEYKWIADSEEKRSAILLTLQKSEDVDKVACAFLPSEVSDRLKGIALRRLLFKRSFTL